MTQSSHSVAVSCSPLVIVLVTWPLQLCSAIAPYDRHNICRTNFRYRVAHDWIPYANDTSTSSGTWKVLLDQYDYQNLVDAGTPAGVWSAGQFSPDSDRRQVTTI